MRYTYKDTDVLINRYNVKDSAKLHALERLNSTRRLAELASNSDLIKTEKFDLHRLKEIHNYIFQDSYLWAGEIRTVDIEKIDALDLIDSLVHKENRKASAPISQFCECQLIEGFAENITTSIRKSNYLQNMEKDAFSNKAAEILGDLNCLHPFREGNGRTQREFMRQLALKAGWELHFNNIEKERMIEASIRSAKMDYSLLSDIIKESLRPVDIIKSPAYQEQLTKILDAPNVENLKKLELPETIYAAYAKELFTPSATWSMEYDQQIGRALLKNSYSKKTVQSALTHSPDLVGFSPAEKLIKSQSLVNTIAKQHDMQQFVKNNQLSR